MPSSRYELKDSHYPEWRGMRFSSLDRAIKELRMSVPPGRFFIYDRQERKRVNV